MEENEEQDKIIPFDPNSINTKTLQYSIGQIVHKLENNDILFSDKLGKPNLWNDGKKSRFIESLILDLPTPSFYFFEDENSKWTVIDGLQRMNTLEHFILVSKKGKFSHYSTPLVLQDLEFLFSFNGKSWDELPRDINRRILNNQITVNIIGQGTSDSIKSILFRRLNQKDLNKSAKKIR
jgi:Protein of unknown function DUF262